MDLRAKTTFSQRHQSKCGIKLYKFITDHLLRNKQPGDYKALCDEIMRKTKEISND